jgi:uncharacterized protein (TIGR03067 family)
MSRTVSAVFAVSFLGFLASAAGQETGDAGKHLKKLQGSWMVVAMEVKGVKLPEDKLKDVDIKLVVKDGKYAQHVLGQVQEEGTFKLDPSKKPAAIDFSIQSGKDKGKTQHGIYEIKGDTWRICVGQPGSKRPTAFTSEGDDETAVMTLKREKN